MAELDIVEKEITLILQGIKERERKVEELKDGISYDRYRLRLAEKYRDKLKGKEETSVETLNKITE
jgi:hypothetical protein